LEVVGKKFGKEITTSKRILLERNYKFLVDSLYGKEITNYKREKEFKHVIRFFHTFA
jgi:hypothetical protein